MARYYKCLSGSNGIHHNNREYFMELEDRAIKICFYKSGASFISVIKLTTLKKALYHLPPHSIVSKIKKSTFLKKLKEADASTTFKKTKR